MFDQEKATHFATAPSILHLDWPQYYERVRSAETSEIFSTRLAVLKNVREILSSVSRFSELDKDDRFKVAGLSSDPEIDFGWFGGMRVAGRFRSMIRQNDPNISAALDLIPSSDCVTEQVYRLFIVKFLAAFPNGGGGISGATRLLSMKRPDVFVCISRRNKEGLCFEFETSQSIDFENYWSRIVLPIRKANWWLSSSPENEDERDVWASRVAFLDSLYRRDEI